jgi:hypothetical protein
VVDAILQLTDARSWVGQYTSKVNVVAIVEASTRRIRDIDSAGGFASPRDSPYARTRQKRWQAVAGHGC